MVTFNEYLGLVTERMREHPAERTGQAMFNVLAFGGDADLEAIAEEIRSTDADPFYAEPGDGRTVAFLWALSQRLAPPPPRP